MLKTDFQDDVPRAVLANVRYGWTDTCAASATVRKALMIKTFLWWLMAAVAFVCAIFTMETQSFVPLFIFVACWIAALIGLRCANCGLPICIDLPKKAGSFPVPRLPSERCSRCLRPVDTKI